jgi:hypothetical protein
LFVGVTIAPTINFNSVKASQQNEIKERINQRELLFQTIVDIVNNKEIQRIILKSQMSRGIFPTSEIPVLTKNQIRQMYFLGLILSKFISKSRIQSLVGKYQLQNPITQEEMNAVIENNPIIKREITLLQDSECDCENKNTVGRDFQKICDIIYILYIFFMVIFAGIINSADYIGEILPPETPEFIYKLISFFYLILAPIVGISLVLAVYFWFMGIWFDCPWAY